MTKSEVYHLIGYCAGMNQGMQKSAGQNFLPAMLASTAIQSVGNAAKGGILGALVGGLSGHGVLHGTEVGSRIGGLGTALGGGGVLLGSLLGAKYGNVPLGTLLGGGLGATGGVLAGWKLPTIFKSKKRK